MWLIQKEKMSYVKNANVIATLNVIAFLHIGLGGTFMCKMFDKKYICQSCGHFYSDHNTNYHRYVYEAIVIWDIATVQGTEKPTEQSISRKDLEEKLKFEEIEKKYFNRRIVGRT